MTRTVISLWNGRIAPVFDVARNFWVVETTKEGIIAQYERRFPTDDARERAQLLATLQADHLVCGAITRYFHEALTEHGIQVVSFVAGELEQVIQACMSNTLTDGRLAMPGCHSIKQDGAHKHPHKLSSEQ